MRRTRDDSADKIAELAGLSNLGNKRETIGSVEPEGVGLSDCSIGSPGGNRTNDQRINSTSWGWGRVTGRHPLSGKSRYLRSRRLALADAA